MCRAEQAARTLAVQSGLGELTGSRVVGACEVDSTSTAVAWQSIETRAVERGTGWSIRSPEPKRAFVPAAPQREEPRTPQALDASSASPLDPSPKPKAARRIKALYPNRRSPHAPAPASHQPWYKVVIATIDAGASAVCCADTTRSSRSQRSGKRRSRRGPNLPSQD